MPPKKSHCLKVATSVENQMCFNTGWLSDEKDSKMCILKQTMKWINVLKFVISNILLLLIISYIRVPELKPFKGRQLQYHYFVSLI